MTSKEAFKLLKDGLEFYAYPKVKSKISVNEDITNPIEKDLEILDILKKHFLTNLVNDYGKEVTFYTISMTPFSEYDEGFEKVKEWLNEEK